MALQKQPINIPFSKGLQKKTDPHQIPIGTFEELVNNTFNNEGLLQKRDGFGVLGSTLGNGTGITSYQLELVALDGGQLFSYSTSQDQFNPKGTKVSINLDTDSVVRNSYQQTNPDSAIHSSGLRVHAWNDSSGGVRYSVFDPITNQSIVTNALISATAVNPKVKALGNYIIISYVNDYATIPYLTYSYIDYTTPDQISSPVQLQIMASGYNVYDAQVIDQRLFYVMQTSSAQIAVFYLDNTLVQSSLHTRAIAASTLAIFGDVSHNVWILGTIEFFNHTEVFQTIYDYSLGSIIAGLVTIENIGTPAIIKNITGVAPAAQGRVFYEIIASDLESVSNAYIRTALMNQLGVSTGPEELIRSAGIATKPFVYNSEVYINIVHDSNLQPTYFTCNAAGEVIAKLAYSNGGGLVTQKLLPEVNSLSAIEFQFDYLFKDLLTSVNGDIYSQTGINSTVFTFNSNTYALTLGLDLHLSGGILSMYDGANVVEHGFNLYPEDVTVDFDFFGGTLGTGQYQYSVTYEWTDNQGLIHRSAPSVATTLDLTSTNGVLYGLFDTTSASDQISATFGTVNAPEHAYVGMGISGPGIPVDTIITQARSTGDLFGLSNNATATATGVQLTFEPSFPVYADTLAGSKILSNVSIGITLAATGTARQVGQVPIYGDITNGSPIFVAHNADYVAPGMTLEYNIGSGAVRKLITSISGNNITCDSSFVINEENFQAWCYITIDGTATSASPTITAVSPEVFPLLFVGQRVSSNGTTFPAEYASDTTVVSWDAGAQTITLSQNASGSGSTQFNLRLQPATQYFLKVGQKLTGTGFTGDVFITEIPPNTNSVTIDTNASSTEVQILLKMTTTYLPRLEMPTLRITSKQEPAPPVNLVVYRTQANETTFYRSSSISDPIINDTTIDSISYIDEISDFYINGNELLYTTGGVLENIGSPAVDSMSIYKSRLFIVDAENKDLLWFSKQVIQGVPVEMSDLLTLYVPSNISTQVNITPSSVTSALDDKFIIFKKNCIYYIIGDGPDNTGANSSFSDPIFVTATVGCDNASSIVFMPEGLMFQSDKGIWLLGRDMSTHYIGADVESFNNLRVTSAISIPETNEVRFTLEDDTTLIYDYYYKQWGTFNNPEARASTLFEDLHTYISPSGKVYQQTPGLYLDENVPVLTSFKTGPINIAGLQGFERFYFMFLLGTYESPFNLDVSLYYDYATTASQTITVVPDTDPNFEARIFPTQQKCETFQVKGQEVYTGTPGAGFTLSGMNLEVGIKKGYRTSPSSRSFG